MKKIIVLAFSLMLALALTGCNAGDKNVNSANDNGVVSDQTEISSKEDNGNIVSDTVSMIESTTDEITSAVR